MKETLTELEGAVLTEIAHRGNRTAFQVRRAFQRSPSAAWSGSAGAVSPAIRRLIMAGALAARPGPGRRGTQLLSLTARGQLLLKRWMTDTVTACSVGTDPFRLRAGLWSLLQADERRALAERLRCALEAEMAKLAFAEDQDPVERVEQFLARDLQRLRLRWVETFESSGADEESVEDQVTNPLIR